MTDSAHSRIDREFERSSKSGGRSRDLLLVLAYQTIIWSLVRSLGFTSISDDDYARVVIAQDFARSPSFDPSGTSWLPFPFWIMGAFMSLPLSDLAAARASALFTSLVSAFLLHRSAGQIGLDRRGSLLATFVALSVPYAAFLGAATVPEHLTSALIVFGATTLARNEFKVRVWGAMAFFLACGSRYEAWPAAFAFALINLLRPGAHPKKRIAALSPALLAGLFPALWMIHGDIDHSDPLFFVHRVVSYKKALGDPLPNFSALLEGYPRALLLAEPEVSLPAIGSGLLLLFWTPRWRKTKLLLPWIVFSALFAGLLVGATRGGAPTHHSERALLSLWFFAPLSVGVLLANLPSQRRFALSVVLAALACVGFICRYGNAFQRDPFGNRTDEELVGKYLGKMSTGRAVGLFTPDYGYFAIQAAGNGAPTTVLRSHDPRHGRAVTDPVATFAKNGGCELVVPRAHGSQGAHVLLETPRLKVIAFCQ